MRMFELAELTNLELSFRFRIDSVVDSYDSVVVAAVVAFPYVFGNFLVALLIFSLSMHSALWIEYGIEAHEAKGCAVVSLFR